MTTRELIDRLAEAVRRRATSRGLQLRPPSLLRHRMAQKMTAAGPDTQRVFEWYSFHNGFEPAQEKPASGDGGGTGLSIGGGGCTFLFSSLDDMAGIRDVTLQPVGRLGRPHLSKLIEPYFPIAGSSSHLYLCTKVRSGHPGSEVVVLLLSDELALWPVYATFEDFLADAIRANEEDRPLAASIAVKQPPEVFISREDQKRPAFASAADADRAMCLEEAARLYEAEIVASSRDPETLLRAALFFWRASDFGVSAAYQLPASFVSHAAERRLSLLHEVLERCPDWTAARFWKMYIEYADLGEKLDLESLRQMFERNPDELSPCLGILLASGGRECVVEALKLREASLTSATAVDQYIVAVIDAVTQDTRRHR